MPVRSAMTNGEDEARVGGIRLTHPDKLLYPAEKLTKRDVALYLQAASERMLAHLANRPVSLLRCPEGQAAQCFFQRHAGPGFPAAIKRLPMKDKRGKDIEYLSIADGAGLLSAVQTDVLEFHIWGAHVDDLQHPDRIVFDLDPDPSVTFRQVREAAEQLRAALDAMGLASFVMLSGGKGVHVVVPIQRQHSWEVVKEFSGALAGRFAEQAPELYIATMSKAKRAGKIFIDYFRNDWTASAICPYSPRAREGATVAWPVTWNELAKIASADAVKLGDATRRLAEPDPWKDYAKTKQSLTAAALCALGVKA
jgi:bifunctional non-homologous end joining protein LigD